MIEYTHILERSFIMAKNNSLTKSYDDIPWLLRVIIQIIGGAVVGGVYRIVRYFETKNLMTLIAGLLATFTGVGNAIAWVVDLITLLINGRYTVLTD
jgi:dolichyl-phosphate-mannose--protein O-mannosyl transferase